MLLSETCLDSVEALISEAPCVVDGRKLCSFHSYNRLNPTVFKEDIDAAPGSVSQVRECTSAIMHLAKREAISVFIVGHVTKEGVVAGPRMLEHMDGYGSVF